MEEIIMLSCVSIGVREVHVRHDESTGLVAIIALDTPDDQPALGGCRCIPYDTFDEALADAARLAKAMSRKNYFSQLPFTGGKAVLMRPSHDFDREAYFKAFGRFVDTLGGRFVTGCDSGVSESDMRFAASQTRHVTGFKPVNSDRDALSYLTALGVSRAMVAAAEVTLGTAGLSRLHVAIQGVGKVGYLLSEIIHAQGGSLTICDKDAALAAECASRFGADQVHWNDIFDVECDVFAPCGIGGVLTTDVIGRLRSPIVCGAANNPLHDGVADIASLRPAIEYIPDFIANAGGAMYAGGSYLNRPVDEIEKDVNSRIYRTVRELCEQAQRDKVPVLTRANQLFAVS
jgi:leucine dehydrogenase